MAVSFIAIGAISTWNAVPAAPPECLTDGASHDLRGYVLRAEYGEASQRAIVEINRADGRDLHRFRISLTVSELTPTLLTGDIVDLQCPLQLVPFGNEKDGVHELQPYELFFARGIGARGFCQGEKIKLIGRSKELRFIPAHISEKLISVISHSNLNNGAQSLLIATMLGRRDTLDRTVRAGFNSLGVAHVLCVSGYHVGLVAWLIIASFAPLRAFRKFGRWRNLISASMVWMYVVVCGAEPAAVRAGIMISIYLFAAWIEDDAQPFNSLCVAIIIILICNPFRLFTGGFLLSVCAVCGILLFAEKLNPFSRRRHRLHKIAGMFLIPICAILGTLPVLLYMFHRFPLYFLPANIVVALLFPLFLFLAFGAMALWQLGFHAGWIAAPANFIADGTTSACEVLMNINSSFDNLYISDAGIWLTAAGVLVFALALRIQFRRMRLSLYLMAGLITVLGLTMQPLPPRGATLYAWSERGRAYAALRTGQEVKIFSETGYSPGKASMEFMKRHGATTIISEMRQGMPKNIVSIRSREKREIAELVFPETRFALLSLGMEPEIRRKYRRALESRGIICYELSPGTIAELKVPSPKRRRRPSEK
ncbi:MAG: ComEC/Rec2 family competence protein [Muribaculaceae bacterium]|nr:ComEC/Rec2 family competence protein [Muribaculaceae bacterium]